ncbi:MAG: hypothetical protein IH945_04595 [Armatimonadetes bacterium]|nr:hypothetical protein [Armatimonadota bacterium]
MTNILFAALALMPATNDGWELKAPFKEELTQEYEMLVFLDMGEQEMEVELIAVLKIDKKTDKGFSGSFAFTDIFLDGSPGEGGTWPVEINASGVLMGVEADEGPGMRRMCLPFFLAYPDKTVSVGDTWKYADKEDDAVDGHRLLVEYKVVEETRVGKNDALKIEFKLKEEGNAPMTGVGHFWVDKNGVVLKYEMDLESWPVPIADDQVFDAEITGEIMD